MRKILLTLSMLSSPMVVVACHDGQSGRDVPSPQDQKGAKANQQKATRSGGPSASSTLDGGKPVAAALATTDIFAELPKGEDQLKVLCGRQSGDRVRQVFCGDNPPKIGGLTDLQNALGLSATANGGGILGGILGSSGFVFSAASSSLVAKFTSAANPRLIMFNNSGGTVAMGYVRGEQFAEIVSQDPQSRELKFFLVRYTQDCNEKSNGCSYGDLLTPEIEKNWRSVTIYEDDDVENTIFDCKQCHQPGGVGNQKILRMQELTNPWTHFMRTSTAGGRALLSDFQVIHGGEEFAGVPANQVTRTDPAKLERFVRGAGFGNQPNEFVGRVIEPESSNSGGAGGPNWQRLYNNFVTGQTIPPPYHDVRVTDAAKLQKAADSYKQYRDGTLSLDELPDMRDVLNDNGLRDMGFMVKAGLDVNGMLIQACSQCHNSRLNQNITRAKFDVDLSKMSREEKDLAIERLKLDVNDPKKMPPVRFRTLNDDEISTLESLFRQ